MPRSLDIVRRVHSEARRRNITNFIVQFENVTTQAQYRLAYEVAQRHVSSGCKVLDWGCGNGHFSFFLESLGARVTGYSYEPRPRAMDHSATFEFVTGLSDSTSALPFDDASFDVVVGVGVLEHVWELGGDERASLAELARVTRPGGTLLTFHLPNRTGWIEPINHLIRPNAHFHKRKFNGNEIRTLWNEAGFDVTHLERYNALPRHQVRTLGERIKNNKLFAGAYEAVDGALERLLPAICTNYCIVGRRRQR